MKVYIHMKQYKPYWGSYGDPKIVNVYETYMSAKAVIDKLNSKSEYYWHSIKIKTTKP